MSVLAHEDKKLKLKKLDNPTSQELRARTLEAAKEFKISWVELAQPLYSIWRDKLYEYWGYDKFEQFTERELGFKKALSLKLVKTYNFIEQQEPQYLKAEFAQGREAVAMPELDALHVLNQARRKTELTKKDYAELRQQVMEKGQGAALVRRDLTALMKERKQVDPEQEREKRQTAAVRRFMNAIRSFKKDAETLKLIRADLVKKADELFRDLEGEIEE